MGEYAFNDQEPGIYVLVEVQPAGFDDISDYDGSIGPDDLDGDDSAQGADNNIPVLLLPGETDADNDFVEFAQLGLICGNVSDDTGNPVPNVTLQLFTDPNGDGDPVDGVIVATTTCDSETGDYCFEDVDHGVYVVVEVQPSNYGDVSDYDQTTGPNDPDGDDSADGPDNNIPVVLEAGEADLDNNFVEDPFVGYITGEVHEDIGNPIPGVTVQLWNDLNNDGIQDPGGLIATTTTDTSGAYAFNDQEPGFYVVVEVQPAGFDDISDFDSSTGPDDPDGDDSPQGADNNIPVTLMPGETDADNDFVEYAQPGLICGNVSDDVGNPVPNVTLQLHSDPNGDGDPADGVIVATTTCDNETGDYCFEDVYHGVYVIVEVQPTNYDDVSDYDHTTGPDDPDGDDSAEGGDNNIPVVLEAGEADLDNDFIEDPFVGHITGEVREDIGNPIPGVTIQLWNDLDNDGVQDPGGMIATAITDGTGAYAFNDQEPGFYVVVQVQPAGFDDISDFDGSVGPDDLDGDDSGQGADNNIPVTLMPGETDADNDFVEYAQPGLICGNVSDDVGNPVPNVTLQLYSDPNGDGDPTDGVIVATTTCDSETGDYCFEDVYHGVYVVVEVQPTNYDDVSDYDQTTGPNDPDGDDSAEGADNNIPVVLEAGEADLDNNFVEDPFVGYITGEVREDIGNPVPGVTIQLWNDLDNDGVQDPGGLIATTTTDAMGAYAFNDQEPGFYVVVEVQPSGFDDISDYDGTTGPDDPDGDDSAQGVDNNIPVTLMPGETDADNDFVEFAQPGLICGNVSDDVGNPVPYVTLQLHSDPNGDGDPADGMIVASTTCDSETGDYCFEDVYHGFYVVVEVQPTNYDDVSDYDHSTGPFDPDGDDSAQGADNNIPVHLLAGEADLDNNFIEDPFVGHITGEVREDLSPAISGVTIQLWNDLNNDGIQDPGGMIATTTTDASGAYSFMDQEPGFYVVVEVQPAGFDDVSDYDGTTGPDDPDGDDSAQGADNNIPVTLQPGETDADNDFLEYAQPGLICGNVSDDVGNPVPNVTLQLYTDPNGDGDQSDGAIIATTTCDSETGDYCFEDVYHGFYVVVEVQPTNYDDVSDYDQTTGPNDPDGDDSGEGPDNNIPVDLLPGEADLDNNFVEDPFVGHITGEVREDTGMPISGITIQLWNDLNNDGVQDPGGMIATTATDASGDYSFMDQEPGIYVVVQVQPANYFDVSDIDGTTGPDDPDGDDSAQGADNNIPVILMPGETDADNDFVEDPYPGAICGMVTDTFDNPIPNVWLRLYVDTNGDGQPDGAPIDSITADGETGAWCFEDLEHGSYVVVQVQPVNYTSHSDYDHSTGPDDPDGDDSSQGPDNDIPVTLLPGEGDLDNNFIEAPNPGSISGQVREDNGSPLSGWTIHLHLDNDGDGLPDGPAIGTTTTDGTGHYTFSGVGYGTYVLVEEQPWNYFSQDDYDHSTGGFDPDGDDSGQGADENIPVFVAAGETDADNDFVEVAFPALICGVVQDELGSPLANVTLELFADTNGDGEPDGAALFTTTTDGETGAYCFEDIVYGSYVIVETVPNTYELLSDYDHSTGPDDPDGDDSGQGADGNIPVIVTPGESDLDNIFINVSCPGLPAVEGDDQYFVCDGHTVTIEAYQQMIPGVTYTWDFGDLSAPMTAVGIGPHSVMYGWSETNQSEGAQVILVLTKPNCPTQSGEVARVFVSPYPDATIDADTYELCAQETRIFVPAAPEIPGATYQWDFGDGAVPATAAGYGPHTVYYATTGAKTVSLWIDPAFFPQVVCPDSATVMFDVIDCPGNIAGLVLTNEEAPLQGVPIQLWPDTDADGQPDGSVLETTFTSSLGQFAFTQILPGNYVLKQVPFPGYFAVWDGDVTEDGDFVPNLNTLDELIPVTVDPATDDIGNTFIKSNSVGGVCGAVFEDTDADGELGAGEGLADVLIRLYADDTTDGLPDTTIVLDSVLTDAVGNYVFLYVPPGDYVLVQEQPAQYESMMDLDATPDGDIAPNVDPMDDIIPVTLDLDETDGGNYYIEGPGCSTLVNTTADSGTGSLREVIECVAPGDTVFFDQALAGDTIVITSSALLIAKDIVLWGSQSPPVVIRSEVEGLIGIGAGHAVIIRGLHLVSGPSGDPAAIDNAGFLTLDDVVVRPNPDLVPGSVPLVRNTNQLTIQGTTEIREQ